MRIDEYLSKLNQKANKDFSDLLWNYIEEDKPRVARLIDLKDRYTGDDVPIHSRTFDDDSKINNKLDHNFMFKIVRTKVGYLFGQEASYEVDESIENTNIKNTLKAKLDDFVEVNNLGYLDSLIGENATIYGEAFLLLYIDGSEESKGIMACKINPWEVIPIYDRSMQDMTHAIRHYKIQLIRDGEKLERTRIEFYDKSNVYYYIEDDDGIFVLDKDEPINPQPHAMGDVPIIRYMNDEFCKGEADRVLSLIDDYDKVRSDFSSEIEQIRMAYLAFFGESGPDDDDELESVRERYKKTGIIWFPDATSRAEFIEKGLISYQAVKTHGDSLKQDITDISGSINITDEAFGGGSNTGIALKYKVYALELSSAKTEKLFANSTRRIFEILCRYWTQIDGTEYQAKWITVERKRNLPANVMEEADFLQKTDGLISKRTAYSQVSFISNPQYELDLLAKEKGDYEVLPLEQGQVDPFGDNI